MLYDQLDNLLCDDLHWPTSSIWVSNVHFVVWSTTLSLRNPMYVNIIFWGFSPQTKINSQLVTYIITQIDMFVYLCTCACVDVHACSINNMNANSFYAFVFKLWFPVCYIYRDMGFWYGICVFVIWNSNINLVVLRG